MTDRDIAARTLCECLALTASAADGGMLRMRLLGGLWNDVLEAAEARGLSAVLARAVEQRGLAAGIPKRRHADGTGTPPQALADAVGRHQAGRQARFARLVELTQLLNRHGIEPLLLKGARSLWTGEPAWRAMGDLDLLVPGRAAEAQLLAVDAGYLPMAGLQNPEGWHHELNLYRKDLPGWLEFHDRAAMHRAEILLPTPLLVERSMRAAGPGGAIARILPMPLDALYCVVHHHISHRGDKFGIMSLKGLYEFADAVHVMDDAERTALLDIARTHPRLLAMLDLWLAAAAERLALPILAPLTLAGDAAARWWRIDGREQRQGNYDGLLDEIAMSLSAPRLRRVHGGERWWGRQMLRLRALTALVAPATVSGA
jgi:hypothetical protein